MTRRPWTGSCKVQPLLELEGFGCLSSVVPFVDHVSRSKRQTAQQPDVNKGRNFLRDLIWIADSSTLGCHLCGIAKFYNRKQQREHFKGKRHLAMQSGTPDSSISKGSNLASCIHKFTDSSIHLKGAPQDTQQVADAGPQDEAELLDLNDEMEQMLGFSRFNSTRKEKRKKKRKKGSNIFENNTVPFGKENFGYWAQRYRLFSRFDEGIQMDKGINHLSSRPTPNHTYSPYYLLCHSGLVLSDSWNVSRAYRIPRTRNLAYMYSCGCLLWCWRQHYSIR